jgi:uncharacterized membrane protein YtjA (UPF0391 family)
MSASSDTAGGVRPTTPQGCGRTLCLGAEPTLASLDSNSVQPAHLLENTMLYYAVIFFVIALVAALFGFTGIAAGAAGVAKVLFFVFIVLAIVSFLVNMFRGRT